MTKIEYPNGYYEGDFVQNRREGYGIRHYADSSTYE